LLEATDGALWVGTDGGVARLDEAGVDVVSTESGLANDHVRALAEDARGRIWIGTGYGLSIWDRGALGALQFEGEWFRTKIRALLRTRDGAMWVGTAQGLQRIEQDRQWSWLPADGLPAEDVRVIHEDRHGSIWIGMEGGGLARFSEGRFARFGPAEGLSSQRVWALLGDAMGWLWIGTDRGLNCLHDGRITTVTTSQGLPDNVVNSLVEDRHGWFWIGHDAGVYRVRREDLVAVVERRRSTARCIPYDEDDGLLNREVNGQISQPAVIRRRDGQIAFATVAGVALFNPDRPPDITNGPPVRIERLLAGGRVVFTGAPGARPEGSGGGPLRIAPQARQPVEIRFAAPNFHAGEQTRFRYRLVGLNPGWADAGTTRSASFAHLRPGHYTFEVFAANHHGYASTQPAWLSFHLEPRLFERAGVQAGAGLLVGGAAMAFGLWRLREVRRLHRLAHETSLARERDRLARDLHDGLGASLTEISLISRGANAGRPESEAADERFELLRQRSAEALQSLRELIWTTNPKADTLESLLARLCEQAQQVLNAAAIRCRLDLPMDVPAIHVGPGFRRAVLLAALEAVTNAARHSQARQVILRCAVGDRTLQIEIVDDGVGFEAGRPPPSDVTGAHGLGLGSMRTRIEELGGRCDFDSQPGRGTRVRFTLPLRWS
jgi:signal transduction histidine kinase